MTRTVPMARWSSGEVLVAYGQNGEMLQPGERLPRCAWWCRACWEGVSWVKYLRASRWATSRTAPGRGHPLRGPDADGRHRQYTSIQECKSVVTHAPGGRCCCQGFLQHQRAGLGRAGRMIKVDVSVDGSRNWRPARGWKGPVHRKCLTRFNIDWVWDGKLALIVMSRATDDTGYVQPTYAASCAVRGTRSIYHNNADPDLVGAGERRGEAMSSFRRGAAAGLLARGGLAARWRRQPCLASAARPRRGELAAWDIDVRPDFRACPPGGISRGQGTGRLEGAAPPATASSAKATGLPARWWAAPRRTDIRPAASRDCRWPIPAAPR